MNKIIRWEEPPESVYAHRAPRRVEHRRRISLTTLGGQLGIWPARISDWEAGRRLPIDSSLRAWAAALGVAVPSGIVGYREPPAQSCGTDAGWYRHRRRSEVACDPCTQAHRAHRRDYIARRGANPP